MSAPKSEHVAALLNVPQLLAANGHHEYGPELARYTQALLVQLDADIKGNETMRRRGHQGQRKAFDIIAPMVQQYIDAIAGTGTVTVGPIDCPAVSVGIGARCIRTDPGHEAHTFPPVYPVTRSLDGKSLIVENEPPAAVCGLSDAYGGGDPDACLLDPGHVLRGENHQGRYSRWPVRPEDAHGNDTPEPDASEHRALDVSAPGGPDPATVAYLRGDTDDLGTPEPPFIEPRGTVTATVPADIPSMHSTAMQRIGATAPGAPTTLDVLNRTGAMNAGVDAALDTAAIAAHPDTIHVAWSDNLGGPPVQPDPFADAGVVPDSEIRRDFSWRPEPDPRPLWLAPYGSNAESAPTAIRVTAVRTGEQCGMAYRLISRDEVPEVPAWWNVGGHTLHAIAQHLEGMYLSGNYDTAKLAELDEETARAWWNHHWPQAVVMTERESPGFPQSQWRAANKGAEGADWWNEVGPHMVRDYAAASAQWHAGGWSILYVPSQTPGQRATGQPAMELEMRSPLPTGGELVGHLDQAWYRATAIGDSEVREIRIRDLKSGKEMPDDEWQLDAYTYLLYQRLRESGMGLSRVAFSVVHYDARNGKDAQVRTIDIERQPIGMQTVYRASSVLRMHEANNYPANPGDTWKAPCYVCAVRYACPIMALRG